MALFGRWDVLHVHWPEVIFRRGSAAKSAAGMAVFFLLLLRARLTGRAVVRTIHNLQPHEDADPLGRALLRLCDRMTTLWIRLNPVTEPPGSGPVTTILHGHYRDWFAAHGKRAPISGRLLFFGQVRPYKGISELIAVFTGTPGDALTLAVVGQPNSAPYRDELAAAAHDPRISLRLEFVSDEELATEVSSAELVVLPYLEMHNSGALLLALSLGRPVLVPESPVTAALAAEVGALWVQRFNGSLTTQRIQDALAAVTNSAAFEGIGEPDLTLRDWPRIADLHLEAYEEARRLSRGGRGQASRRYSE